MQNTSETVSEVMEPAVASRTERIQRTLHKTGIRNIVARQGLLSRDSSLRGPDAIFTGRQSDVEGAVMIVRGLPAWHA